jgi:hypothetical protein
MDTSAALNQAWSRAVDAYRKGRINSERTLQAHLYSSLQEIDPGAVVFCEPQLVIESFGTVVPDMVLVRDHQVEAVLELKFVPHHFPLFEGDLAKLKRYAEHNRPFNLCLDPGSGRYSQRAYTFAASCQFVFAVIGRPDSLATDEDHLRGHVTIGERFMPLVYKAGT